jgi:penicillin-binding protein 2
VLDREVTRSQLISRRAFLLTTGKISLLSALLGRMFYLQILKGSEYKILSDKNRISLILIPPIRGAIFDKNKKLICENRSSFLLKLDKRRNKDYSKAIEKLFSICQFSDEEKKSIFSNLKKSNPKIPVTLINDMEWEKLALVEENIAELKGIYAEQIYVRKYNFPESFAHISGYVGKMTENDLRNSQEKFSQEFQIGKTGLEKQYESYLQGEFGLKKIEVDAKGNFISQIEKQEPISGQNIDLNIDSDLQEFTHHILPKEGASALVLDLEDGKVLAACSTPAFDPNKFVNGIDFEYWNSLINNPYKPLVNKISQSQYPPGSTFKLITILAALEAGIKPDQEFTCVGHVDIGKKAFHCWNKAGHGTLNMSDAIKHSCNSYMFNIARLIGADRILELAKKFGFGTQTNIDLPSELKGFVPDRNWKLKNFKFDWSLGDSFNISIGQGALLATPIQQLKMIAAFASNGKLFTPRLSKNLSQEFEQLNIKTEYFSLIKDAMFKVVNESGGTGSKAYSSIVSVSGKTGTSQVIAKRNANDDLSRASVKRERRNHALFAGFFPYEEPQYAVNIIVDHGGGGGAAAGPIAKNIAEYIYKNKL